MSFNQQSLNFCGLSKMTHRIEKQCFTKQSWKNDLAKLKKIQIYDIFKINSFVLMFSKNWLNTIKKPC